MFAWVRANFVPVTMPPRAGFTFVPAFIVLQATTIRVLGVRSVLAARVCILGETGASDAPPEAVGRLPRCVPAVVWRYSGRSGRSAYNSLRSTVDAAVALRTRFGSSRRHSASPEKSLEADETIGALVQAESCVHRVTECEFGGRRGCQTHVSPAAP
jgi:hypothetical protein